MDDEIVRLEENMAQLNTADQFIQPANTSIPTKLSLRSTSADVATFAATTTNFTSTSTSNNHTATAAAAAHCNDDRELKSKEFTTPNDTSAQKILVIRKKGFYLLLERLNRILLFILIPLVLLLCKYINMMQIQI